MSRRSRVKDRRPTTGLPRVGPLFAVFSILCSVASAQWLETTILLPDSLTALLYPRHLLFDPERGVVYLGGSRSVLVLDASTGISRARIPTPTSVSDLCLAPEHDKLYVSLSLDSLLVLDANTHQRLRPIRGVNGGSILVYNGATDRLYAASRGGSGIAVVDCTRDSVVGTFTGFQEVNDICINPAGSKLYCADYRKEGVVVIDCATGNRLDSIWTGTGDFTLLYNHISDKVYCSDRRDEDVAVIDAVRDTLIRFIPLDGRTGSLALNPLLNRVYCATSMNQTAVLSGVGDSLLVYAYSDGADASLAFDSVANVLCAASQYSDRVTIIDGATSGIIGILPTGDRPMDVCCCPGQGRALTANYNDATVSVIDVTGPRVVATPLIGMLPEAVVWASNVNRVYCAEHSNGHVAVVDGSSNQPMRVLPIGHRCEYILPLPEENKLYCTGFTTYDTIAITVLGQPADTVVARIRFPGRELAFSYHADRHKVYCMDLQLAKLSVIDCRTDSVVREIGLPGQPNDMILWVELDRFFVSGDSTIWTYDAAGDTLIATISPGVRTRALCKVPPHDQIAAAAYTETEAGLAFIDVAGCSISTFVPLPGGSVELLYNSYRDRIYSLVMDRGVAVVDCARPALVDTIPVYLPEATLLLDTIADRLYMRSTGGLHVISCLENRVLATFAFPYSSSSITWNPVNRRIYVVDNGNSALAVIRDSAVAGAAEAPAVDGRRALTPTVVRGVLHWQVDRIQNTGYRARVGLLDISGRVMMELQSGPNDVSRLAAGVYFVREQPQAPSHKQQAVRKVLIQR